MIDRDFEYISELFEKALKSGWKVVSCSCRCGGRYAWLKEDDRMVGCICHTDLKEYFE